MVKARAFRVTAVAVLAVSAFSLSSGTAEAKGKPVRVTLTCTNAVGSASATVQLLASIVGVVASGPLTVDCGADSVSGLSSQTLTLKASSLPAGAASYSITQSAPAAGGCAGRSIRPFITTCNTGITLTVS
jgi:hypothetical protein